MAWLTTFSGINMNNPLFGDLENDQFFGRATFNVLTSKQIDILKGTTHNIFRGSFDVGSGIGSGEILDGTFRSLTVASGTTVSWTLTGLGGVNMLDALDRASHLADPGDPSPNYTLNTLIMAGSDRIDDESAGASTLSGYGGQDTLVGNAGDDVLNGGSSFDQMFGGLGNDTFVVDNASDQVVELPGEGTTDMVQSSVSYVLGDSVENLTLLTASNLAGRGNSAANVITGNAGNNFLHGRGGNDTLSGTAGDDTLEGGPGNDSINGASGSDTASFQHSAKAVTVSLLVVAPTGQVTGAGTDTLAGIENLWGSQFNDSLTGDAGDNVIEGGLGDDTMQGGQGSDTASYAHAKGAITLILAGGTQDTGGAGTDTPLNIENVIGSSFADSLTGSNSANVINGGLGNDTLAGSLGADSFVFDNVSSFDTITDFAPGVDQIVLMATVMPLDADGPGVVLPEEFVSGAGKTFPDNPDQHIVYNTTDGTLYYYQFGNQGGGVHFATLTGVPLISAGDIVAG